MDEPQPVQEQKPKEIPIYLALFGMLLMGIAVGGILVYQAVEGQDKDGLCIPGNFYGVLYPPDYIPGDAYYIFNRTKTVKIDPSIDKGNFTCPEALGTLCENPYQNKVIN